jgi:hypothetical protein
MVATSAIVETAYAWHGGGGSPLYSFASCGGVVHTEQHRAELVSEIELCIGVAETETDRTELNRLLAYVKVFPLDEFTRAYIETALWSSHDESDESGGEPMDANYSVDDLAPEALATMIADCADFQASFGEFIADDLSRAGHDFWLTRSGHGAGFWDGDWPDDAGQRLTDAAHGFGECSLYIGDDGLIYTT